jgi:hypothetical protein
LPQYFFHVYDDIIAHDEEGNQLPNEAAARLQALKGARELAAEQVKHGYLVRSHWIDVADEKGDILMKVTFGDAVEVRD